MASTQAGQPPGGEGHNDPSRGPPDEPPSYDWTSSSSSYDSTSGEDMVCETRPLVNTTNLPLAERQRREENREARQGIRAKRDERRQAVFEDLYRRSKRRGIELPPIHAKRTEERRAARDARPSRGGRYKYDADDEAKEMTREYRRRFRLRGRERRIIPVPQRDLAVQERDRAKRHAMRDARRRLRNPATGEYDEKEVEEIGQRAYEAKRDEQSRRASGQSVQDPRSIPAIMEYMVLHNTHGGQSDPPQALGNFQLPTEHPRFIPSPPRPPPAPRPSQSPRPPRKRRAGGDAGNGALRAKRRRKTTTDEPGPSQQPQMNPGLAEQSDAREPGHGQAAFSPASQVPTQPPAAQADSAEAQQPPPQEGGNQGAEGNAGAAGGGRGGRGRRGGRGGRGGRGSRGPRGPIPRPDLTVWKRLPEQIHPALKPYYIQDHNLHAGLQPEEIRLAVQEHIMGITRVELEEADAVIGRNFGGYVVKGEVLVDASPVARDVYAVEVWPDSCKRCLDHGIPGCNIREIHEQNPQMMPPPECDNCSFYRYNEAPDPQAMDHDCTFETGPGNPPVTAERKNPDGRVVNFLHGELWQCEHCALEGRYCDADRLMSVCCTTCQSKTRVCTIRGSAPLRERDYLRALERGFRIMCRLCCKAGKQCSWTDSTEDYGSGRPCKQCLPFESHGQKHGACTTFSKLPVTGISGGFNPIPMANVLPSLDARGVPTMIQQRPPWRSLFPPRTDTRIRRQGNGALYTYKDPEDPDWNISEKQKNDNETKNPEHKRPCEFCYYTVSECTVGSVNRDKACGNCTYLGIKCLSRDDLTYGAVSTERRQPREWWNLANGMGYHRRGMTQWTDVFRYCASCRENGRTCDRKRPCESCQDNGAQCDQVIWGEGVFVADRHPGDREHTYYLGLGYGPQGLGTPMLLPDPTHMACGPKDPMGDGMPNHMDDDPEGKERLRAERCHVRETQLRERYGYGYTEPGSRQIPAELDIERELPDPTARVGWPGSFIRNDREPLDSAVVAEWRSHPPGIAAYPNGALIPGGLGPEPDDPQPPHPPLAAQQLGPQQPQQPFNGGGQENLPDPGTFMHDLAELYTFLASVSVPEAQLPSQPQPQQGQPGQGPPVGDDEVMEDARPAQNEGGLLDFDNGAPLEAQPPGTNAFVPIQEDHNPAPPDEALAPFRLGPAFTEVTRFMPAGYEVLKEDRNAMELPPGVRGVQPSYPWRMSPDEAPAESDKARALQRMEYPGNNVLRDIPEKAAEQYRDGMKCKDSRPPLFMDCENVHSHGWCENLRHGNKDENIFPVCCDCDTASKALMFDPIWGGLGGGIGITAKEILMMRAYFCADCSKEATDPQTWHETGNSVYGFDKDARKDADPAREVGEPGNPVRQGGWKSEAPLPVSGCNCMGKLLGRVLCAYHRLFLAQKMIRQAAMMQEFRFRRYGTKICPKCQRRPGLDSTAAPQADNVQRFWVCVVCNGMVASEERGPGRQVVTDVMGYLWFRGWEKNERNRGVPPNLHAIAQGEYSPGYGEEDFEIECDDGDGEDIEVD